MFERLQQLQHTKGTKVFGRGGAGCKFLSLTKDAGCACPWPPTSRSTWEIPWTSRDSTPGIVYKDTAYLLSSVWVRVYIYVVPAIVIDTLSLYPYIYIYLYEPD